MYPRQLGNAGARIQTQAICLQGLRLQPADHIASGRKHLICERIDGLINNYLIFSSSRAFFSPSKIKEGNIDLFSLQITEQNILLNTKHYLFVLILIQ